MTQQTIVLIAGPTASGKSALALDVAHRRSGTIINADAMQVYAGLPILTAQPSLEDRHLIPHLLYEVTDAGTASSVGQWLKEAQLAIQTSLDDGRTPIIVGGTGLYFEALRGGLAEIPSIPLEVRDAADKLYCDLGERAFRAKLAEQDPVSAARIAVNDRQRLIRAYGVAFHTGHPLSYWQLKAPAPRSSLPGFETCKVETHLLSPPRKELYAACDGRLRSMIGKGAIEEVKKLLARELSPDLPSMKILGVREIGQYLAGTVTLETAVLKAQQMTRNYAKRQTTWFRNRWKQFDI